jgi:hypothetical protein
MTTYAITINGVDRTDCIENKSVQITDESNDKASSLRCSFFDKSQLGDPVLDQEIIVLKDSVRLFAGRITNIDFNRLGASEVILTITATDYHRDLDRNLVVEAYEDMTDKEIIEHIIANYCQGTGITAVNVIEGVTINKIVFNYVQPSQCFRKLCDLTGRSWYIDYDKDVHYFPPATDVAPFNIDSTTDDYSKLKISKDNADIRNRVYVRGSTYLSDAIVISQVADGEQIVFLLPNKPHEFTMKEGGVTKSVGILNVDDPAGYDYMLNYQEKYVTKANGTPPAATTVMEFTFKYDIPVLVAVEDRDSIEDIGQFEYAIFDTSIQNLDDARSRAQAELADYANSIIDGSFETLTDGFRAGQYLHIDLDDFDIDDNYYVQKVSARSLGGGEYKYTVSVANTKKLGIILFLIKMLENDKNALNIDPNEVVDELFTPTGEQVEISDSLISDSLISPPFKWGSFKWGLAEWS